jgi:hypothetical protein
MGGSHSRVWLQRIVLEEFECVMGGFFFDCILDSSVAMHCAESGLISLLGQWLENLNGCHDDTIFILFLFLQCTYNSNYTVISLQHSFAVHRVRYGKYAGVGLIEKHKGQILENPPFVLDSWLPFLESSRL